MPRIQHRTTGQVICHVSSAESRCADFCFCDLSRTNLVGADLRGAVMLDASLSESDLSYADLQSAQLAGADLRGANLTGAILLGVQLLDAIYDRNTCWPAAFNPSAHGALFVSGY